MSAHPYGKDRIPGAQPEWRAANFHIDVPQPNGVVHAWTALERPTAFGFARTSLVNAICVAVGHRKDPGSVLGRGGADYYDLIGMGGAVQPWVQTAASGSTAFPTFA